VIARSEKVGAEQRMRPSKSHRLAALGVALVACTAGLVACNEAKQEPSVAGPRYVDGVVVGELYDPAKYEECKKARPGDSRCEVHRLKRIEQPEYWPYPDVPPVKWPDPPRENVYRKGMTGIEYWQALCKAAAGEFIYRVVEDVEGLYVIRPRSDEPEHSTYDRWVREDPYGFGQGDHGWEAPRRLVGPTIRESKQSEPFVHFSYLYLERTAIKLPIPKSRAEYWHPSLLAEPPVGAKYALYFNNGGALKTLEVRYSKELASRYGFTWRGIRRQHDRELGVAGGEMVVVDLKTNEVLGMKRGFRLGPPDPRRELKVVWSGSVCPEYAHLPGYRNRNTDSDSVLWFLTKVAKPKLAKEYVPARR